MHKQMCIEKMGGEEYLRFCIGIGKNIGRADCLYFFCNVKEGTGTAWIGLGF